MFLFAFSKSSLPAGTVSDVVQRLVSEMLTQLCSGLSSCSVAGSGCLSLHCYFEHQHVPQWG